VEAVSLLCYKRGCDAADHLVEFKYCEHHFAISKVKSILVRLSAEHLIALHGIKLNKTNTRGNIYMFLSGSIVVECAQDGGPLCKHMEEMSNVGAAERIDTAYYVPCTLLLDEILENMPMPDVADSDYEIKKYYIISARGLAGEEGPLDVLARFLESASVFLGKRISKVLRKVPYIPQLVNKYADKIDILLKTADNTLIGFSYTDASRTYHLGLSAVKSLLMYGLDHVILLHPYVSHDFHRQVANRIRNRWDVSEIGYIVINQPDEELYLYKYSQGNRYLRLSRTVQSHSSIIRGYVESL
jgi:hypothetical protein